MRTAVSQLSHKFSPSSTMEPSHTRSENGAFRARAACTHSVRADESSLFSCGTVHNAGLRRAVRYGTWTVEVKIAARRAILQTCSHAGVDGSDAFASTASNFVGGCDARARPMRWQSDVDGPVGRPAHNVETSLQGGETSLQRRQPGTNQCWNRNSFEFSTAQPTSSSACR